MKNEDYISESNLTRKLKPFVSSLRTLRDEYEQVIIDISMNLPSIEAKIDDSVLEARELLNFIFSSKNTDKSYGIKHEMDHFHNDLNETLNKLKQTEEDDRIIFQNLKDSIDLSTSTLTKVESIRDISENLKVFAINSIIYSQKSGNRGKGYHIISGEFIRLSETIAAGTETIRNVAGEMFEQIRDFNSLIDNHEEFFRKHIESISDDSDMLFSKADKSVENFSMILNDLLDRIERVKNPTALIMNKLQTQDIIHQQLAHLMEAIDDIITVVNNTNNDAGGEREGERNIYSLLRVLMITVETQIRRISEELYEMISSLEELFDDMSNSIIDINTDKSQFSELVNHRNDGSGPENYNSIVDIIFRSPENMIKKINSDLHENISRKMKITDFFSTIEEKICTEKDIAQTFVPVIDSINNLLILARIEKARYELNIHQESGSGRGFFSNEIHSELAEVVRGIETAHEAVAENLEECTRAFLEQSSEYGEMNQKLGSSLAVIEKTRKMFIENFNLVLNITSDLFNQINHHIELFSTLRELVAGLTDKIGICEEIKDTVDKKLDEMGGPINLEENIFKHIIIKNIVERCTVENERISISEKFEEFSLEESTGNNITLF